LLQKIAPTIGATVLLEPVWKIAGQITFKSGKRSYFRYNTLDLNPVGASDIAKDKDYANFFMAQLGYPVVPRSKVFFSQSWADAIGVPSQNIDAAYAHALTIGLPVIVKPNSGSQGYGVCLVHTKRDFYTNVRRIFRHDKVVLVQPVVLGSDVRIVVLDNDVISAYIRRPLSVTGNGKDTIEKLLEKKQRLFNKQGRDTKIRSHDPRLTAKLARQNLVQHSVLDKGQHIYLLDNANLSTGGDSIDITDSLHASFKALAITLTKDMGLRFCGVDMLIADESSYAPDTCKILEINAAPGLDHYSTIGSAQAAIVEDLYRKVLTHLGCDQTRIS